MKSKYLPVAFIAVVLVAGAAWWFWVASPAPLETPVVEAPPPSALPPEEPDDFSPLPEVAVATPAPVPAPPPFDPQAELGTAIQDFARLAQSGDMLALMLTYMTPDEQARMGPDRMAQMQAMIQGPVGPIMTQLLVTETQAIQNATPTYDETGNRATFARPAGSPGPGGDIIFVKVNGRWYRE